MGKEEIKPVPYRSYNILTEISGTYKIIYIAIEFGTDIISIY